MDKITKDILNSIIDEEIIIKGMCNDLKKEIKVIRDKSEENNKLFQERICYLINISYLRDMDNKIYPYSVYNSSKGTYRKYLRNDYEISSDRLYLKFKDIDHFDEREYIIPIDIILCYDKEKEKKFGDYIAAQDAKIYMDDLKKSLDESKLIYKKYDQEYKDTVKEFENIHKDNINLWNMDFQNISKSYFQNVK